MVFAPTSELVKSRNKQSLVYSRQKVVDHPLTFDKLTINQGAPREGKSPFLMIIKYQYHLPIFHPKTHVYLTHTPHHVLPLLLLQVVPLLLLIVISKSLPLTALYTYSCVNYLVTTIHCVLLLWYNNIIFWDWF